MNRTELRQAVSSRVAAHSDWSDRRLAESCGASRTFIAKIRRDLVADGRIEADEWRQSRDGRIIRQFPRSPNRSKKRLDAVVRRLSRIVDHVDLDTYRRADPVLRGIFHELVATLRAKAIRYKREGASLDSGSSAVSNGVSSGILMPGAD